MSDEGLIDFQAVIETYMSGPHYQPSTHYGKQCRVALDAVKNERKRRQ